MGRRWRAPRGRSLAQDPGTGAHLWGAEREVLSGAGAGGRGCASGRGWSSPDLGRREDRQVKTGDDASPAEPSGLGGREETET